MSIIEIKNSSSYLSNRVLDLRKKEYFGIFTVMAVIVLFLAVFNPNFATQRNIVNILLQIGVVAFMALGLTFVIASGGIDLSVPGVLTLSGVLGTSVMAQSGSIFLGLLTMLLVGLGIGALNGFAIARLKMGAFIVTLSIWMVTGGIATWYTKGVTIVAPDSVYDLGSRDAFIIPIPVIGISIAAIILFFFLEKTTYGRSVCAIGTNEATALTSGIKVGAISFSVYVISGFCASLAGLTLVSRLGMASSGMGGFILILDAISAVIIGGASLNGGKGSIIGTLGGILIIALINNGLTLFGVSHYLTDITKGVVIFLAVLVDAWRTR